MSVPVFASYNCVACGPCGPCYNYSQIRSVITNNAPAFYHWTGVSPDPYLDSYLGVLAAANSYDITSVSWGSVEYGSPTTTTPNCLPDGEEACQPCTTSTDCQYIFAAPLIDTASAGWDTRGFGGVPIITGMPTFQSPGGAIVAYPFSAVKISLAGCYDSFPDALESCDWPPAVSLGGCAANVMTWRSQYDPGVTGPAVLLHWNWTTSDDISAVAPDTCTEISVIAGTVVNVPIDSSASTPPTLPTDGTSFEFQNVVILLCGCDCSNYSDYYGLTPMSDPP